LECQAPVYPDIEINRLADRTEEFKDELYCHLPMGIMSIIQEYTLYVTEKLFTINIAR